mmetsp:Transcript_108979/g.339626  ORF Transcript_108979/g.339626 Transcript_108979/m.339626 type:complete len:200 (-) Transcript_108979:2894-3493(-)
MGVRLPLQSLKPSMGALTSNLMGCASEALCSHTVTSCLAFARTSLFLSGLGKFPWTKRLAKDAAVTKFWALKDVDIASWSVSIWCEGCTLQQVKYAASSTIRPSCDGSSVLRVTSMRHKFTYSLHISMISVSCCSSRASLATERGMACRAPRKIVRTSLNFPWVVSLWASLTLSRIFAKEKRITGVGSFDLMLLSTKSG